MKSAELKKSLLLYAVTDRSWLKDRSSAEELYNAVDASIEGGVTFVQLREKNLEEEAFLQEAFRLKELCRTKNIPFVINDNVSVAEKTGADGVHIGQDDMSLKEVRRILGNDKIIGVSCHSVKEAVTAEKNGADYLGVGAVFSTATKNDADSVSIETLSAICRAVSIPVVAIGGISLNNIHLLKDSGIAGVAVVSAIYAQNDISLSAQKLKESASRLFS